MTALPTLSFRNLAASPVNLRSTCALISSGAKSLPALGHLIFTLPLPSSVTYLAVHSGAANHVGDVCVLVQLKTLLQLATLLASSLSRRDVCPGQQLLAAAAAGGGSPQLPIALALWLQMAAGKA
jgi:hypothetical protein